MYIGLYGVHSLVYFCSPIYTYSKVKPPSLYTENMLSTLLKSLIQYYSVHWSIRSTLSSLYLFTKSISFRVKPPSLYTEDILSTAWSNITVYTGLYGVHSLVYFCSPIYTYSKVKPPSLYTENMLSSLLKSLIQYSRRGGGGGEQEVTCICHDTGMCHYLISLRIIQIFGY